MRGFITRPKKRHKKLLVTVRHACTRHIFTCVFGSALILSCRSKGPGASEKFFAASKIREIAPIPVPFRETKEPLKTLSVQVHAQTIRGVSIAVLTVEADPRADFVQYSFCSKDNPKNCSLSPKHPGKFRNSPEYFPSAKPGPNIVMARSCIRASRIKNKAPRCSEWKSTEYIQPELVSPDQKKHITDQKPGREKSSPESQPDASVIRKIVAGEYDTKKKIQKTCDEIHKDLEMYRLEQNRTGTGSSLKTEERNFDQLIENLLSMGSDLNCEIILSDRFDKVTEVNSSWLPWVLLSLGSTSVLSGIYIESPPRTQIFTSHSSERQSSQLETTPQETLKQVDSHLKSGTANSIPWSDTIKPGGSGNQKSFARSYLKGGLIMLGSGLVISGVSLLSYSLAENARADLIKKLEDRADQLINLKRSYRWFKSRRISLSR